ncbi:reverse transcriptase domain-containing protein [Tanacetum coccineum]
MPGGGPLKMDGYNTHNRRDHYQPYVSPIQPGRRYDNRRFEGQRQEVNQLSLEALIKKPKEILATERQLQLPPCPPMIGIPKKENLDRYCDYYGEKGHYTNDCYQLKRQLEAALESGKLNHLVKDLRQRGNNRGRQVVNNNTNGRIINMVMKRSKGKKRKYHQKQGEDWMNVPVTFPPMQPNDVSNEPLIVEAEVEGYLIRRIFVDQDAAVQVMFEHCFGNLPTIIQARLTQTHTELVGFSGEQLLPIGKIELEVTFGNEGLCRRTMMKFTVVQASSPYNVILGRTWMRELRAISSTTHAMMKFPTPRGIATLVSRIAAIFECRQLEEKQIVLQEQSDEGIVERNDGAVEEGVMVNPAFPDQKVVIGAQLSPACRRQLINLLKDNQDVFAWQPSDIAGVPRRIIQHSLNVNMSITPVAQKRRILGAKKIKAVIREVEEWIKTGIVRPVRYPTWISNPVLVKKVDGTWRMCIDFKNINLACPKDYYPLPEIDLKIEAVMGFPSKFFLDAYKGYHQI